ncbi:6779_t:CDS:2, partial [Racocetra persica]
MSKKTNLDIADNNEDTNSAIATHEVTNIANGENNIITVKENNKDEYYMVQSIIYKLKEYWDIIKQSTILPTLLDPYSKLMTFVICEAQSTTISILRE